MTYLLLFLEFFKTGLLSVGGGLATLPFLYQIADRYDWFTRAQLSDMIAVSESTPGPIGVNMATYAGVEAGGILGGVIATFGLVLPSILVILVVARFLQKFQNSKLVRFVLSGLRPASVGLIAAAGFGILRMTFMRSGTISWNTIWSSMFNWKAILLCIGIGVLYALRDRWHPVIFIAIGAAAGIALGL